MVGTIIPTVGRIVDGITIRMAGQTVDGVILAENKKLVICHKLISSFQCFLYSSKNIC